MVFKEDGNNNPKEIPDNSFRRFMIFMLQHQKSINEPAIGN